MTDKEAGATPLIEQVSEDTARLIEHLRCSHAPDDVMNEASGHIQKALDLLTPHLRESDAWSAVSLGNDTPGLVWREDDLTACMPFSPVSGKRNAIAPSIQLRRTGDEVVGEARFSPTYAGPPNSVHGGIIAAVFDELLSFANVITGTAGFTGTLSIRYHQKTPIDTPVELWAENVKSEGRKQISRGEMRVNGQVTASAEGLFIAARELNEG